METMYEIPRIRGGMGRGARLKTKGLKLHIAHASWGGTGKDAQGLPEASVRIAHTNDAVLLRFEVREAEVRAVNARTHEPVWQDSRVEFFFNLTGQDPSGYYNLECNAIGTILYYFGTDRHQRAPAPLDIARRVKTRASLGKKAFDTRAGPAEWSVDVVLPVRALFRHEERTGPLSGRRIAANFYKCGDKLSRPHYLSWQPIRTENPDFHRPEFFAALRFS